MGNEIDAIENADMKLDRNIKNILSYRPILARIFKETVCECKDMTYDEIEKCIEGDMEIDIIGLNPGMTNSKIEGRNQEDSVHNEGKITFDIRTVLRIPSAKNLLGVKLLVDIEAQKDDNPGYDITERAIFYCCRMISSQLTVEFTNQTFDKIKYGNLKKVYSIWICMETSRKKANTIERYALAKTVYPVEKEVPDSRYDLLEAIIVNVGKTNEVHNVDSELINLLSDLFDEKKGSEEKVILLNNKYNIPTTEELETEVESVNAYAAGILNRGRHEGILEGRQEGLQEGKKEERIRVVQEFIRKDYSKEFILDFGYTEEEYEEAQKDLLA